MELSNSQIESLFEFSENNGIHYYDVQLELVDHLAAKIEADMATDGSLTFPEALKKVFNSFGLNGFEEVLYEKKKTVIAQRRKVIFEEVKQWFTFQRLTLILSVGLATYFLWTTFEAGIRMWILWAGSLLLWIYQFRTQLQEKLAKKILLFDNNGFKSLYFLVTYFLIVFVPFIIYSSWHIGIIVHVVLVLLLLQVITHNLDRRLLKKAQALYPEAIALKVSKEELQKQKSWYKETLSLPERTDGEAPLSDWWPRAIKQPQEMEPFSLKPNLISKFVLLLLLSFIFCYLLSYFHLFILPVTATSEEVMLCYLLIAAVVALAYKHFLAREKTAIMAYVETNFPTGVNAFQMAYFLHEPERAIQTAIVDLVEKGALHIKDNKTMVVGKVDGLQAEGNPILAMLWKKKEGSKINLETIISTCYKVEGFDHPQLEQMQKRLSVFLSEEALPHLFILVSVLHVTREGSSGPLMWLIVLLVPLSFLLFVIRRDGSGRKKIISDSVKRKYVAETDLLNTEEVDPLKRFAVQSNPSLITFSQPALLNSILVEVRKSTAIGCDGTGGEWVENFEGARSSNKSGGLKDGVVNKR